MAILQRAKQLQAQGVDVIHLEVGEPDFSTPDPIIAAGIEALTAGHTQYTPATGLPELKTAIRKFYQRRYQHTVDADCIAVTAGASGALQLVIAALVEDDAQVLITDPGYPCNAHFVRLFGGEVVLSTVGPETRWQPNLDDIEQFCQQGGRAVLLASPANPTGTMISPSVLDAVADITREYGCWLILDEIYHGLCHEQTPDTAAKLGEHVIVVNSFSKYFGMTGWRLGWAVLPPVLVDVVDRLAQNLFLAPPTVAQHAALAAFTPRCIDVLEQRREQFTLRRDALSKGLEALGFTIAAPADGAFYLYVDASKVLREGESSEAFALEVLEKTGVAITPGNDFDSSGEAAKRLRFAYTTNVEQLLTACQRIGLLLSDREQHDQT